MRAVLDVNVLVSAVLAAKGSSAEIVVGSRDPDDDYFLALAIECRAYLVTGDQDLLVLSHDFPIFTPAQFAAMLRTR